MAGKRISFDDKEINKSNFCKNNKIFSIHHLDANKMLVSKKNHLVKKIHSNTSLDIMMMMMMSLHHYA